MEQYRRFFTYIEQANKLVYDYYSVHAFGCLCHYFNLDKENSIIEDQKLEGGSYEFFGDMSGIRFTKILLLPVFFVEPIQPTYTAEERGYIHESESSIVIPSTYEFIPYEHDIVYFPSNLNPSLKYPIYEVVGIEKSTDTPTVMYRCRIRTARTSYDVVDAQVTNLKVWFEPEKCIVDDNVGLALYTQLDIMTDLINSLSENEHVTGLFVI